MNKPDGKTHRRGGLTLKRSVNEGFTIDKDIEIVVVKTTETCVYLSIKAPGRSVLRMEILKNQPRHKVQAPDIQS